MKTIITLLVTFCVTFQSIAQTCLSGDCENGYGKIQYLNGTYEGNFVNGEREGQGTYKWDSGTSYTGSYKNGNEHGYGKNIHTDGVYEGEFVNGKRHGQGTYIFNDGTKYVGNFKNGEIQGHGKYDYGKDGIYEGDFVNGIREGKGTYYLSDGNKYVGNFKNGVFDGYGTAYNKDGDVIYSGQFKNGEVAND